MFSPRFAARAAAAALMAASALASAAAPARAAELIMFEEHGCMWCARWNEEVGDAYHLTAEGRRAPLVRRDIHDGPPEGVTLSIRPGFTPTFVLVENGLEVGRIEGYPGEDFFWPMLNALLARLPAGADG
ncbi:hypothetical protein ACQ5SO_20035 [Rhodovulum sp. DZ06]|uniref:hypothetical protein n=1 Tax=Rhodovulum sp. DZ06 TaxID=3425126 RepID=UPI003D33B78A